MQNTITAEFETIDMAERAAFAVRLSFEIWHPINKPAALAVTGFLFVNKLLILHDVS